MRERALRRRCRRLFAQLDLDPPLNVERLCARLGEVRGRPLRLVPYPLVVPGPFGLWMATDDADWIIYQQETTRTHQEHIILHEVGHVLAEHDSDHAGAFGVFPPADGDGDDGGDGGDDGKPFTGAGRRTMYDTREEWEAETVATLIKEWAAVRERVAAQETGPSTAALTEALCDRRGWL